jgi:AbrB family looped-hinge helix DNA binding protein
MSTFATTKMSSKGQVVIPEEIRNKLGLKPGSQFVVLGQGDVVVLKAITVPSMDEFYEILADARRSARRAGLKRSDVTAAVAAVRAKR